MSSDSPRTTLTAVPHARLNPIWIRELRQTLRLRRTPLLLAALTILVALLVCSLGALSSLSQDPARVGPFLYQAFFSAAFGLVTWLGPGVTATMIASERSAATWDILVASGVKSAAITRGKFGAALTYAALCLVTISPIAVIPLLFEGVTPAEITVAFLLLAVTVAIAVGFGLSIGSTTSSVTLALLLSVPAGAVLSVVIYLTGIASSYVAESQWRVIVGGMPLWLPTVLTRAELNREYLVYLIVCPLTLLALALWFFYEITVANLSEPNDDRTTRLRYWFVTAAAVLYPTAAFSSAWLGQARWIGYWITLGLVALMSILGICVFAGDALSPSPRVSFGWERHQASKLRRFFGPGIVKASISTILLAFAGILGLVLSVVAQEHHDPLLGAPKSLTCVLGAGGYLLGFIAFLAGFTAFVRSRSSSGSTPRLLLTLVGLSVLIGPWLIAGALLLLGAFSDDALLIIGSPSPAYLIGMVIAVEAGSSSAPLLLTAGAIAACGWFGVGALLLWGAQRRIRQQERV